MPRGAGGQLRALEQYDLFHAQVTEVIGDRAADDTAADDDDAGVGGEGRGRHWLNLDLRTFQHFPKDLNRPQEQDGSIVLR